MSHLFIGVGIVAATGEVVSPSMEIYGHWTYDETKLETEIIYAEKFVKKQL
ncbi:MAG: hypothetical protein ACRENG_34270 [bacterium]